MSGSVTNGARITLSGLEVRSGWQIHLSPAKARVEEDFPDFDRFMIWGWEMLLLFIF